MPTKAENTERLERLAHERIPKLLLHYGVPAVVGTMVNALYSVVDRIFIGQGVSEFAITGLALTFPILLFIQAFGMLIGVGASARVSILLGENQHDQAERILSNALLLTLVTQLLTLVPIMIWLEDILRALGANDRTLPFAYDYLKIMIPGNIFSTLCFSFNGISLQGDDHDAHRGRAQYRLGCTLHLWLWLGDRRCGVGYGHRDGRVCSVCDAALPRQQE